jgi:superoxide dismutase, Cu-Zn family
MHFQSFTQLSLATLCALTLSSCACRDTTTTTHSNNQSAKNPNELAAAGVGYIEGVQQAIALIEPTSSASQVKGRVTFTKVTDGVRIVGHFEGLTPGDHGFHVHEFGDCGHEGEAAGGHFNPTNRKHGAPSDEERHIGDFGNVTADAKGKAVYDRIDKVITLSGDNSIIGHSIVIHADRDDLKTQPSGASGKRIGCGIIEAITVQ